MKTRTVFLVFIDNRLSSWKGAREIKIEKHRSIWQWFYSFGIQHGIHINWRECCIIIYDYCYHTKRFVEFDICWKFISRRILLWMQQQFWKCDQLWLLICNLNREILVICFDKIISKCKMLYQMSSLNNRSRSIMKHMYNKEFCKTCFTISYIPVLCWKKYRH